MQVVIIMVNRYTLEIMELSWWIGQMAQEQWLLLQFAWFKFDVSMSVWSLSLTEHEAMDAALILYLMAHGVILDAGNGVQYL
jgi:hypothetical protein